jgi:hypothetical protein
VKRIIIGWSGKEEYLGLLFNQIDSEIRMGKKDGFAYGYFWSVEDVDKYHQGTEFY